MKKVYITPATQSLHFEAESTLATSTFDMSVNESEAEQWSDKGGWNSSIWSNTEESVNE